MTTLVIITYTNFRRKPPGLELWYPKIHTPPTFEHHASSQFSSPLFPYIQMKPARNILYAPKAYFIYILDEAEHQCCVYMLCLKITERVLSSNNFRRIIWTTPEQELTLLCIICLSTRGNRRPDLRNILFITTQFQYRKMFQEILSVKVKQTQIHEYCLCSKWNQ